MISDGSFHLPTSVQGTDSAQPMPRYASYPLEAELRLRRSTPVYIKTFLDRNSESATENPRLIYSNKDVQYGKR